MKVDFFFLYYVINAVAYIQYNRDVTSFRV